MSEGETCIRRETLCQKGKFVSEGKTCQKGKYVLEGGTCIGKHESEGRENVIQIYRKICIRSEKMCQKGKCV